MILMLMPIGQVSMELLMCKLDLPEVKEVRWDDTKETADILYSNSTSHTSIRM